MQRPSDAPQFPVQGAGSMEIEGVSYQDPWAYMEQSEEWAWGEEAEAAADTWQGVLTYLEEMLEGLEADTAWTERDDWNTVRQELLDMILPLRRALSDEDDQGMNNTENPFLAGVPSEYGLGGSFQGNPFA